jgi:sulfite reductase (NADPH) flavoprotein alpha-component
MSMPWLLKRVLFRTHWILGISAGLVLAVVGVTGAILGFEEEILDALNPHHHVEPRGKALSPDALIARVREAFPERTVAGFTWHGPAHAVDVRFDGGRDAGSAQVDPYDGKILAPARGGATLGFVEQLHRNLAAGPVGKQLVGASTIALIIMALTGVILRFPRRWFSPRAWLRLDFRLKGRSFLWHLHAVTGTWVLVFYLTAALTGLWWSYEFYRNAVNAMAGVTLPQRGPGGGGRGGPGMAPPPPPIAMALDPSWRVLVDASPVLTRAMVQFPRQAGAPLEWRYLGADAPHDRGFSTLRVDPGDGRVIAHERYAALPKGRRFISAMLPLHSGSYFGLTGRSLMAFASVLMPLFTVTGIWLWLKRRREARISAVAGRALAALNPVASSADAAAGDVLVVHASQGGTAERLAWQTAQWLQRAGLTPRVRSLRQLDAPALAGAGHALFVVATYGDGDPPDSGLDFARRWMRVDAAPEFARLHCAVLALGNRRYAEFCAFGKRLAHWLTRGRAQFLFDIVEAQDGDANDVERWRENLSRTWPAIAAFGDADVPLSAESDAAYGAWQLRARHRVDPNDDEAQRYELELIPVDANGAAPSWQPGDSLDLRIEPDARHIDAWLTDWQLDPVIPVRVGRDEMSLFAALSRREPPRDPSALRGLPAQAIVDRLAPLSARSYSIASLTEDGFVRLLARMTTDAQGRPGLASAALRAGIAIGGTVHARLHRSAGFTFPSASTPLVLIANGVGIAPFLAALESRARAGSSAVPSWLLYGERSDAHVGPARARLTKWSDDRVLARIDYCYSRQGKRRYVQDALRDDVATLREWLARGAAIYVCGSPAMGEGIETLLRNVLGDDAVERLRADGRYRRELF